MRNSVLAVILVGLVIRLELASFAGHPGDLGLFAYSSRMFYETGRFDTLFPAMPLLYYVQLAFYSFYVLLRNSGFGDFVFMYHSYYMVEGLFLRLPFILSDLGVFLLILQFTQKLKYAAFYFLNPFIIYLTGAWGIYDSLMLLPLVAGFLLLSKDHKPLASFCFVVAGLIKVFGFVPFGFLAVENLVKKQFKEFLVQLSIAAGSTAVAFAPYLQSGIQDFYVGFVLRFAGLSGARTRVYNLVAAVSGVRFGGSSPFIWLALGVVGVLFVFHIRRAESTLVPVLLWSIVAGVFLYVFSQSEPQWLSWIIPLSIIYAHLTQRGGLANYVYFFGVASTFLSITILQSSGYLLFGTPVVLFDAIESFPNSVIVYATTVLGMLLLLLGYVFHRPVRFRFEVIALVLLVYLHSYFWFSIMRIVTV